MEEDTFRVNGIGGDTAYEEPQGEVERAVANVWAHTLGVERIGRNDNFFELGGDSRIGLELTEALATSLAVELPVVTLFQNPTIREISAAIVVNRQL